MCEGRSQLNHTSIFKGLQFFHTDQENEFKN